MIEVLFAESEAGSMKVAKNTVVFGKTDEPTSVWMEFLPFQHTIRIIS